MSNDINIHSISIMTDKGEFTELTEFTLDEGVELEFNHTDNTLHFRPTTPLGLKSTKTVYEWMYKAKYSKKWIIAPMLMTDEEASNFYTDFEYKKTGRSFEVEV